MMEIQELSSQRKLARTSSSLSRTATIHSSIQSLTTVDELDTTDPVQVDDNKSKTHKRLPASRPISHPSTTIPLLALAFLAISGCLFFVYLKDKPPISRNVLLCTTVLLFGFLLAKRWRLWRSFFSQRKTGERLEWSIGNDDRVTRRWRSIDGGGGAGACEGVDLYSNGDCYEGELYKGKWNGSGVYSYNGKGRYEGDWVDGKYDGYGMEAWGSGSQYGGQYTQGLRHGFGAYLFHTGDSYSGQWLHGQSHGAGLLSFSDGSCYVGQLRFGTKHGLGYYHFRNGDRYCGEYFGGRIHGFGIYHFANGPYYEGSWHHGRRQGFGAYTFRNGSVRSGEWDCGVIKTLLPPSHPRVQLSIYAARRAELDAATLPRVEKQVEKAIATAKIAANAARVAATRAVKYITGGEVQLSNS